MTIFKLNSFIPHVLDRFMSDKFRLTNFLIKIDLDRYLNVPFHHQLVCMPLLKTFANGSGGSESGGSRSTTPHPETDEEQDEEAEGYDTGLSVSRANAHNCSAGKNFESLFRSDLQRDSCGNEHAKQSWNLRKEG